MPKDHHVICLDTGIEKTSLKSKTVNIRETFQVIENVQRRTRDEIKVVTIETTDLTRLKETCG